MGELQKWLDQDWVRIGTDGKVKGECGTYKDKKNPDRCLPRSKAKSRSKTQLASTAKKKKKAGASGKTVVKNTKSAEVQTAAFGGEIISNQKRKRPYSGKKEKGAVVARGCGAVMENRRKHTKGSVCQ